VFLTNAAAKVACAGDFEAAGDRGNGRNERLSREKWLQGPAERASSRGSNRDLSEPLPPPADRGRPDYLYIEPEKVPPESRRVEQF